MVVEERGLPRASFLILSAGHLLAFADRAKIAGAMPAIRLQLAMSDATAGWVIGTSFAVGYGVTLLLIFRVHRARRMDWKRRMVIGVAVWTVGSLCTGLAPSVGSLLAARMAAGCGQALFLPAALDWITIGARRDIRSSSLATFVSSAPLGRSLGLLMIGTIMLLFAVPLDGRQDGWRWAFVITAVPNVMLLRFVWKLKPLGHLGSSSNDSHAASVRLQIPFLALALLPILVIQALAAWAPTIFVQVGRMNASSSAISIGTVTLFGSSGGALVAGYVMRRWPLWQRYVPNVIAFGLLSALPLLTLFSQSETPVLSLAGLLLADITLSFTSFAGLLGWQQLRPPIRRDGGNDLLMVLVTIIGFGVGPLLIGAIAQVNGTLGTALIFCTLSSAFLALIAAKIVQPGWQKVAAA